MERDQALEWLRVIAYTLCDAPISDVRRWNDIDTLLPDVLDDLKSRGIEPGKSITPQLKEMVKGAFSRQAASKTLSWCSS